MDEQISLLPDPLTVCPPFISLLLKPPFLIFCLHFSWNSLPDDSIQTYEHSFEETFNSTQFSTLPLSERSGWSSLLFRRTSPPSPYLLKTFVLVPESTELVALPSHTTPPTIYAPSPTHILNPANSALFKRLENVPFPHIPTLWPHPPLRLSFTDIPQFLLSTPVHKNS